MNLTNNKEVEKNITTIYLKENTIDYQYIYTKNIEFKNKIEELTYFLLLNSTEKDYNYLMKNKVPLYQLELIYFYENNELKRTINFINIVPNINQNQEFKQQLSYFLLDIQKIVEKIDKIKRNDLCPCGSGKKFKKCCLKK